MNRNIEILYEDKYVIVCIKPVGYLSQKDTHKDNASSNTKDMVSELGDVFPVHRLDQGVGGVMVYAKNKDMAAKLSGYIQNDKEKFVKEYIALVSGGPELDKGILQDLLFRDSKKNKSFVVKKERKGVKKALLEYEVLERSTGKEEFSKIWIRLYTGRTHQIRVQFASRKMSLVGDGKYGSKINSNIGLWSYRILFYHPYEKKMMEFSKEPPEIVPWVFVN